MPSWPSASAPLATGSYSTELFSLEDGKIVAVGPKGKVEIPGGTPTLTAAVVTPGLIDAHTTVGLSVLRQRGGRSRTRMKIHPAGRRACAGRLQPRRGAAGVHPPRGSDHHSRHPGQEQRHRRSDGHLPGRPDIRPSMTIRFPAGILVNLGETPKSGYPGKAADHAHGHGSGAIRSTFALARNHSDHAAFGCEHGRTMHSHLCNAAMLTATENPAGHRHGLRGGGYVPKTRVLRHEAAHRGDQRSGPRQRNVAITLDAARILKASTRRRQHRQGKLADLVLYCGRTPARNSIS